MDDREARAFVVRAVADGLKTQATEVDPKVLTEVARRMVDVIVDSYFKCRLTVPASEEKTS